MLFVVLSFSDPASYNWHIRQHILGPGEIELDGFIGSVIDEDGGAGRAPPANWRNRRGVRKTLEVGGKADSVQRFESQGSESC